MLAQASQAKTKQINAQFEVNVASKDQKDSKVQMEFNHAELFKFYTQVCAHHLRSRSRICYQVLCNICAVVPEH
jgi:hypothetical protein